jgi:hypothetical protein
VWPPECHTWENKNIHEAQPLPITTDVDLTVPVPAVAPTSTLSGSKRKSTPLFTQNKQPTPGAGFLASRFGLGKSSPERLSAAASTTTTTTAAVAAVAASAAAASAGVACPREFVNRPGVRTLHFPARLVTGYEKNDEWCVNRIDDDPPIAFWMEDPTFQIVFDR